MRTIVAPVALALLASSTAAASVSSTHGEWNRFRGPDGAGLAHVELPDALDPAHVAWKTEVPAGNSSPCLTDERLFVTGVNGNELETLCLSRADGKILWRRAVSAKKLEEAREGNSPATPTPTTDGKSVIAYFGSFGLVCWDVEGKELWRRELPVPQNTFGTASSPVIADGKLVFLLDAEEGSFLEALDPATGATLWRKERDGYKSGWSTPGLWTRDGRTELLVLGVSWLNAYDLADGSERWSFPGLTDEPITTPIAGDGLVYATSYNLRTNSDAMQLWPWEKVLVEHDTDGDEVISAAEARANTSVLSRPDADGEGDHPLSMFQRFLDVDRDGSITPKEYEKLVGWVNSWEHLNGVVALRPGTQEKPAELVWHYPRGVPECPSPLVLDGRIYMVMNGGTVTCLDAKSGTLVYQGRLEARGPYYASLVGGDGKVLAASARGEMTLFAAGPELKVLSTIDLDERLMATPALDDGVVFVRTESSVRVFGGG